MAEHDAALASRLGRPARATRISSSRSTRGLTPEMNSFCALPAPSRSSPVSSRSRPPVSTTIASVASVGSAGDRQPVMRRTTTRPPSQTNAGRDARQRASARRSRAPARHGQSRHPGEPAQIVSARRDHRHQPGGQRGGDEQRPQRQSSNPVRGDRQRQLRTRRRRGRARRSSTAAAIPPITPPRSPSHSAWVWNWPRDIAVGGTEQVQDLDHRLVDRQAGAGGEHDDQRPASARRPRPACAITPLDRARAKPRSARQRGCGGRRARRPASIDVSCCRSAAKSTLASGSTCRSIRCGSGRSSTATPTPSHGSSSWAVSSGAEQVDRDDARRSGAAGASAVSIRAGRRVGRQLHGQRRRQRAVPVARAYRRAASARRRPAPRGRPSAQ